MSAAPAAAAAAWCGSSATADRAPNVVAGNPIHWVYLIPSDGADNLGSVAPVMQADAEQVDAWWRGQDSTRAPRNDLATFPCATQLDITTVRSPRPGLQLAPLDGRFSLIFDTLEQAGLTSQFTKYLVYYDGPSDEDNVCGQGGSNDPNGFGLAVVFYRSCVGISTAAVAAHEFLHTTGAVPDGTPHACTGDSSGHTCDSDVDLMYPFIGRKRVLGEGARSRTGRLLRALRCVDGLAGLCLARAPRRPGPARPHGCGSRIRGRRRAGARVLRQLHDDVEQRPAARAHGDAGSGRQARSLGGRVLRKRSVLGDRRSRYRGLGALRSGGVPAHGPRRGSRVRAELRRNPVPAAVLRGPAVVPADTPDGRLGEGLEAPLLGRRMQGRARRLHRADERGDERSRDVRSTVEAARGSGSVLCGGRSP